MAGRSNLAATLGGWSARHRLAAIGGWLAFVIVTMLIGGAAGQVTMTHAEYGTGESGRSTWLLANAGIKDPARELVLVHSLTAVYSAATAAARSRPPSARSSPTSRPRGWCRTSAPRSPRAGTTCSYSSR